MARSGSHIIRGHIRESIRIKEELLSDAHVDQMERIAKTIATAFTNGNKLLIFGNGGSAADAQHLVAEFVGKYRLVRRGLPAIALTANSSSLTAIGNDYAFESVFARQIEAIGGSGDIALGISTSGKSRNVIAGLEVAKANDLITIGLTGRDGGSIKEIVDHCLCVPSENTPSIQEGHIMICHILCELVEWGLFGSEIAGGL